MLLTDIKKGNPQGSLFLCQEGLMEAIRELNAMSIRKIQEVFVNKREVLIQTQLVFVRKK